MVFSSSGAGSTDRLEVDAAHENCICPGITKNRPGNNRAKSLGYERYEVLWTTHELRERIADGAAVARRAT